MNTTIMKTKTSYISEQEAPNRIDYLATPTKAGNIFTILGLVRNLKVIPVWSINMPVTLNYGPLRCTYDISF